MKRHYFTLNKLRSPMKTSVFVLLILLVASQMQAQATLLVGNDATLNLGDATLQLTGANLVNEGTVQANVGTLVFAGSASVSLASGGAVWYRIRTEMGPDADLHLLDDAEVSNQFIFNGDNNVLLGNHHFTFGENASCTGQGEYRFFTTNGTGRVRMRNLGAAGFTFPVGRDWDDYSPITVVENGTPDLFAVRCLDHPGDAGANGNPITEKAVDVLWDIADGSSGGNNLTLTATWLWTHQELPGFDDEKCGLARWNGSAWDMTFAQMGPASSTSSFPKDKSRTGVTSTGYFAIGGKTVNDYVKISPKALLQGPSASGGLMNNPLKNLNLLPLDEPYSNYTAFSHKGFGGEEVVTTIPNNSGNDAIVDWVFLELRSPTNSVLLTRSAFLQKDGNVVDLDGISPVTFHGVAPGDYYFVVRHRNHLGVRSAGLLPLVRTEIAHDFTQNLNQAYKPSGHPNEALASLAGGYYGLWAGNANLNGNVRYSGPANDQNQLLNTCLGGNKGNVQANVYNNCDLNMNGNVRFSGPANDQNLLLNTVLSGDKAKVVVGTGY
jgi:hypothetical protein